MKHNYSYRLTVGGHMVEGRGAYDRCLHSLTLEGEKMTPLKARLAALRVCRTLKMKFNSLLGTDPVQFMAQCTERTSGFIWEGGMKDQIALLNDVFTGKARTK